MSGSEIDGVRHFLESLPRPANLAERRVRLDTVALADGVAVRIAGRLAFAGQNYAWRVRGVSFDDAFRNASRGAAQVLSGNGQPDS